MYERLKKTFRKLNIDHEIIFVNDGSPDDSEEVIRAISRNDRTVQGISHSRNFGSQAAFRSGMEISKKNSCVLLDGDLQDPPELIETIVTKWREGYDVVYGRRVKRDASYLMQFAYKAFYRVFDYFSYLRDSARRRRFRFDGSPRSRRHAAVSPSVIFSCGASAPMPALNRPAWITPGRKGCFGVTTNSLLKNIGWAKKVSSPSVMFR